MKNRDVIVAGMRRALATLSKELTSQYSKDDPESLVPGVALKFNSPTDDYAMGAEGLYYGGGRLVIGPRIGEYCADLRSLTSPANDIDTAVAALSEKRVCSVLRNMVVAVHSTFPALTFTAEKESEIPDKAE